MASMFFVVVLLVKDVFAFLIILSLLFRYELSSFLLKDSTSLSGRARLCLKHCLKRFLQALTHFYFTLGSALGKEGHCMWFSPRSSPSSTARNPLQLSFTDVQEESLEQAEFHTIKH